MADSRARYARENRRRRITALLLVLLLVVLARLGGHLYRWYAHAEERAELGEMRGRLEDAGYHSVRTQLVADSLRGRIERLDRELDEGRAAVAAYDAHALRGTLPAHLYEAYQGELEGYNRRVARRNALLEDWKQAVAENHLSVERYNLLVDSIRGLAASIGEPYVNLPSPAEIASARGLVPRGEGEK